MRERILASDASGLPSEDEARRIGAAALLSEVVDENRLPGVLGHYGSYEGLVLNPSPIAVSCSNPVRWRDTHCEDEGASSGVLSYGTEYDWMGFYYAISNAQLPEERWSMVDIFDASIKACKLAYPGATSCAQREVSWAGWKGQASLIAGAAALKGENSHAALAFIAAGKKYGVNDEP